MIFNNAFPIPPEEMLKKMLEKVKLDIHTARQKERQEILDRYTGKDITGPIERFFDSETTLKIVSIAEHNIIKRIVNRESMVYKDPPEYTFAPDKVPEEYDQTERWMAFKKAERRTNAIGTGLIHSVWRSDRLQWDYIHNYEILTVDDPLNPSAIIYPLNMHSGSSQLRDKLWVYWDSERHFLLDANKKKIAPPDNPEMINPYGVLPFITVNPDDQDDEYWVESPQVDTVNVMDAFNKGITEARLAVRYAAGQRVVSGNNSDKNIQTGLEFLLDLSPDATYQHVATDSNFDGMIKTMEFDLNTVLESHGMSAEFTESGGPASGYSLLIRNLPLLENREDDAARWRRFDQQVYAVDQEIMKFHKHELPKKRSINYPEVTFPLTADEQQQQDDWDLEHGLITTAQILRRRDPDGFKSDEDAQKVIDENRETQAANLPPRRAGRASSIPVIGPGNAT